MNVIEKLLDKIREWAEYHEYMFDHSKYRPERTPEEIKKWKKYHDEVMNS